MSDSKKISLVVDNIHCPSCVSSIEHLLSTSRFKLSKISISILTGSVSYVIPINQPACALQTINECLISAGFDIVDLDYAGPSSANRVKTTKWFNWESNQRREAREAEEELKRIAVHKLVCRACIEEDLVELKGGKGKLKASNHEVEADEGSQHGLDWTTILSITGMTCASCVGNVAKLLSPANNPSIIKSDVTLLPGRAVIQHTSSIRVDQLIEMIEDAGYDAGLVESKSIQTTEAQHAGSRLLETKFVISGMTCSSCIGSVNSIVDPKILPGVQSAVVTLLPPLATIVYDSRVISADQLAEEIEDGGYGAEIVTTIKVESKKSSEGRQVRLRVDGMFCVNCVNAINSLLGDLQSDSTIISFTPLTLESPFIDVTYHPSPPIGFTLRSLRNAIVSLGPFTIFSIRATDTLDDLARRAQRKETRSLSIRLAITFIFAVPTFIIAMLGMAFLNPDNSFRRYLETPVWGSAPRGTICLFILATPVQFGVGSMFYERAWKGVRGVWRRDGPGRWKDRLFSWGSMDSLVVAGTTTAYVASFVFMVIDINTPDIMAQMSYFDASVLLILFILLGRLLEGMAKRRTGDAVSALGKMKPVTGLLYKQNDLTGEGGTELVEASFIEVGDILLIPSGSAVPLDSTLLPMSSSSSFDESSLTGESMPVLKQSDDFVLAGSTNLGPSAVIVRVEKHSGETMIDGIVDVVRDAMSKKASIEKLADTITGYFVPAIVFIALFTFIIWIVEGYSGALPVEWLPEQGGSWTLFAVQFAVAVLVVSCPCGIGLAAPTAQMVGTGICARLGIVPYGGGEAFQLATKIDCVVFDKTGTLTSSLFTVSNHYLLPRSTSLSSSNLWKLLEAVEQGSSHPISIGLRSFCQDQHTSPLIADDVASNQDLPAEVCIISSSETPGRGLQAEVLINEERINIIVGNALFMSEMEAIYGTGGQEERVAASKLLLDWSGQGQSVVLVAISLSPLASSSPAFNHYTIVALFGIEDLVRPEASYVITELERQGIAVFVCSGDNPTTTLAVARRLGMKSEQVFAGVLPGGKKEVVESLQNGAAAGRTKELRMRRSWWTRLTKRRGGKNGEGKAKVLFVGDGINDLLALTQADVGVSMGTGASVALSSSDFCLLSSNLLSLLTLLSLARATFNKIVSNFIYACVFNTALIPLAGGLFYSWNQTALPPIWAAAAMALSSVSVVSNSLALRLTFKVPKVVRNFAA